MTHRMLACACALFTVAAPAVAADLVVSDVDVSMMTVDCRTLAASGAATAAIANIGDTSTGAGFSVLFFEDGNGNGLYDAGFDQVLGLQTIASPLAAGDTATAMIAVDATVAFAGNLVHVLADSEDEVAETDETNNTGNSGSDCEFMPPPGGFDPAVEWSWTGSAVEPAALNVMMTPSVIDLDGDGTPDVVFGSTASTGGALVEVGYLRALRGNDGTELFTVTAADLRVNTASSVAVGDIDLDGRPEILACRYTGDQLTAFEHDGTLKWHSPVLEAVNWGAPSIADLDQDGTPEIVIGRQVLRADGTLWWTGTAGRGGPSAGAISIVADVDLDGAPEVVAGNTVYDADGTVAWQNLALGDGMNAVADFDDDPNPEIVLVYSGQVWLLEHTGAVKWGPVTIPAGGFGGPPTVADYDGDGDVEIGVAGAARYAVFETDGSLKWAALTQDSSSNRTGSSVFDFEGDGSAEVIYRDELKLRIYRGTDGFVLYEIPMSSCTWHEYPLVADVDADGNAEIVAVANNNCGYGPQRGVYVIGDANDTWVATRELWNQHAYHITNIADDGSIPAVEADNWLYPPAAPYNNYRQNVLTGVSPLIAPDLTASWLRIDETPCPDAVGLVARIGNGGANVAAAPVAVTFYDGDPDMGGVYLGTVQTTTDLAPGEFEDVTLAVSPPLLGAHTICAVADEDGLTGGTVSECDETNNMCCAEFAGFCVILANLDIKPGSCPNPLNVPSKGVLPVALLGTADFDVGQVDLATVRLEGVPPKRSSYEDVAAPFDGELCDCIEGGPDGFTDLTLKFSTPMIVEALGPVYDREYRVLTLTGNLLDGTPFEASDCVRVQGTGLPDLPPEPESGDLAAQLIVRSSPSQPVQVVSYRIPEAQAVRLQVFDLQGRLVDSLVGGETRSAGEHAVRWNAARCPSGIYFLRLETDHEAVTRKVLIRR